MGKLDRRLSKLEAEAAIIVERAGDGGAAKRRVLDRWQRLSAEEQDERLGRILRGETATRAGSAGHAFLEAHRNG